ncbi:MAG: hypothetical protein GKS06_00050 [Acidobacteria bacterium]|nr:hypothetical protein [Acidobacteriota bacterium]
MKNEYSRAARVSAFALIGLFTAVIVWAMCPADKWSDYGATDGISTISIQRPGGGHNGDLTNAMNSWNSCNGAELSVPKAPLLDDVTSNYDVEVVIHSGAHSDGTTCGEYDADAGPSDNKGWTGKIEIWKGTSGCGSVESVLAHELGHVLALDDFSNAGGQFNCIMNQNSTTETPNSAECNKTSSMWMTVEEEPQNPGPGPNTPLVFDLDRNGIYTSDVDLFPVNFDIDADGNTDTTGWTIPGHHDGFLWLDLNGNRRVDDGSELFGSASVAPDGSGARHGFEALAAYDDPRWGGDGDGQITRQDRVWSQLRMWVDEDGDGVSDRAESRGLGRHRIVAIDLDFTVVNEPDGAGNWRLLGGAFWVRGLGGVPVRAAIEDVVFRVTP